MICVAAIIYAAYAAAKCSSLRRDIIISNERCSMTESERDKATALSEESIRQNTELRSDNARLQERLTQYNREIERLNAIVTQNTQQHELLLKQSEASFRVMANDIMQQHSDTMRRQNEQRLSEILAPLKENIDRFRHDVFASRKNKRAYRG